MNDLIKDAKELAAKLAKLADTDARAWKALRKVKAAIELMEEKPAEPKAK